MICSAILPGLGQLVNRNFKKFIFFIVANVLLYVSNLIFIRPILLEVGNITPAIFSHSEILILSIIFFAVWVFSVEDAWIVGRKKIRLNKN